MHSPSKASQRLSPENIAAILVSEGAVPEGRMQEALQKQRQEDVSLGEILVEEDYLAAEDLARILSRRLNIEYVVLSQEEVDPGLIGIIGEETLVQCEAVPLRIEDGKLVVAMSDPVNGKARSCVVESAGRPIVPVAAAEDAIRTTRERLLGNKGNDLSDDFSDKKHKTVKRPGRKFDGLGNLRMGEILVEEGKISEEQLHQALDLQNNDPRNLGEILLSLGLILPEDLAKALARRLRLDYVALAKLGDNDTDSEALNLIDEETCRKYKALPLRFGEDNLVVAMSDPNDLHALEDLRIIAKRPITPVVAAEEDLNEALNQLFGVETEVHEEPVENAPEKKPNNTQTPVRRPQQRRTLAGSGELGDILLEEGKISGEQLRRVQAIEEEDPRQIGEIMLALGYVSEADLAQATAWRLRLEYIELTDSDVDRGLLKLVDQKVLRRYDAVPLRMQDGRLAVAMSDPKDIYALEDLRMISGHPITPVVATKADIQRVQNKLFALGEGISEFLEESAEDPVARSTEEIDLGADAGPGEAPIIRLVSSILQQAVSEEASDIHIEPQAQEVTVRFRVDGVLREVMSVPRKLQGGVVARLKVIAGLNIAERRVPQDGRFSVRVAGSKIDLRVATLPTAYGEKVVLRLLDTSNVEANLGKLGFADRDFERYEEIFTRPYGAILVTGPTGSGKSTTLYATLNELNSPERNIITVEDPVEYQVTGLNQIQVNPRAGLTFASGLRSILRSDPDVIMIGEIRDAETAKISVESALTGHLVLATLHTNNAPGALTRLTEMGVEPFLTSSAVDCVIAQRLGRRLCERCKQPTDVERSVLEEMDFPFHLVDPEAVQFYKACGCDRCNDTGYRGRVGFYEVMVVNDELKELVLRRVSTNEVARAAEAAGMVRLREDGLVKASQGLTTIEEVLRTVV